MPTPAPIITQQPAPVALKPFVIHDPKGNNYVDGVRKNSDNSVTIFGRNALDQPIEVLIFDDERRSGFAVLSIDNIRGDVGRQIFANREAIFEHFGIQSHPKPKLGM